MYIFIMYMYIVYGPIQDMYKANTNSYSCIQLLHLAGGDINSTEFSFKDIYFFTIF